MSISNTDRDRIKRTFEPIALAMGRAGLTPDALTLIGFAITVVGAVLLGAGYWLVGGLVVFGGGVFDMFDGTLARATGQAGPLGAFMDSVFDRWGEAIVYVGITAGAVLAGWDVGAVLATAAMAAAFMVSYARAKSDGLGFSAGMGMAAVGLAPREIRLVILSAGLVLAGLAGGVGGASTVGTAIVGITLGLIAILATLTVIQRIVHVRRQAAEGTARNDR
jgi:CDP-diacylglycerol--glycerol-3-phosphate 3-phosphatidyltransferase